MAVIKLAGVEFVSFRELAKDSGISPEQLQKAVSRAGLTTRKFGREHCVNKAQFEKWIHEEKANLETVKRNSSA